MTVLRSSLAGRRAPGRRLGSAILLAIVVGVAATSAAAAVHHRRHHHARGAPPAGVPQDARALSRHPIPEDPEWRSYVLDSPSPVIYPRRVSVQGGGSVDDPNGLLAGGGGATLHATGRDNPLVLLDLGVDTGGRVEVGIARTDGTEVDLAYSEARRYMTDQGDSTGGSLGNDDNPDGRSDAIKASGPTDFVSPGIRGGERWIALSLHGPGTVTVSYVRVRVGSYRPSVQDYVGHFLSSDPLLNRVWYASAYTLNLVSIRDAATGTPTVMVDGAKRDRLVWLGDLALDALTGAYTTRASPQFVRDSIDMFSCQQYSTGYIAMASDIYVTCPATPPPPNGPPASTDKTNALIRYGHLPEYTVWWVIAEYESLLYGGDRQRAQALLPVMRQTLAYLKAHTASDGLFQTDDGAFPINWHPFDYARGEDTHTNATWVLALRDLAAIERLVGDPAQASADDTRANGIAAAMMARLWDPTARAFILNSSDPVANHAQDANVQAVLAGVISGQQAADALGYISAHLETPLGPLTGEAASDPYMSQYISPYISSWELLARLQRGDGQAALSELRREFGYMATHDPASTMWEKLTPSGNPASYEPNQAGGNVLPGSAPVVAPGATSLAHGWSTGPAPALSGYVLGLRPTDPGWSTWTVAPQPVDLRFAQGQAGTPSGPLVSRWARGTGDRSFVLTVSAPAGTRGTVAVPLLGAARTIARDGVIVWRDGAPANDSGGRLSGGAVVFPEGPGQHTYAWGTAAPAPARVQCPARRAARRRAHLRPHACRPAPAA